MLENLPKPAYEYKVFDRIEDPLRNFWWIYIQYKEITPKYAENLYREAVSDPDGYLEKGLEQQRIAQEKMKALADEILSKDLTLERFMLGVYYMTTTYMWADREIIIDGYPGEYSLEYYAREEDEIKLLEMLKKKLTPAAQKTDKYWYDIQDFFFENLPNVDISPAKAEFQEEVKKYVSYTPTWDEPEFSKSCHHYITEPFFKLPYLQPGTGRLYNPEILPKKTIQWRDLQFSPRGISPGTAIGQIVYHVGSVSETEKKLKNVKHPVLFAIHTQPKDTPLFYKVVAVITTEGGILSHTGITAREVGIPAITGVPFRIFPEYSWVIVDGTNGVVQQISEEEAQKLLGSKNK